MRTSAGTRRQVREGERFRIPPELAGPLLLQGERLRERLRCGANPVTVRGSWARVDGIAGAMLVGHTQLEIVPKFLRTTDSAWVPGMQSYLNYAGRRQSLLVPSATERSPSREFVDATALQFCEMLEAAREAGLPMAYQSQLASGHSPRGSLRVTPSLRHVARLSPTLEWDEVVLDEDTPTARVIRRCLQLLSRACRDPRVRLRVERNLASWPSVPSIMPDRTPNPPRSWAHFGAVAALAFEICNGLGRAPGQREYGYAYVVNMIRTFERAVERAVATVAAQLDGTLRAVAQDSTLYATGQVGGARDYYTRADSVLYAGQSPVLVLDAKYKALEEAEATSTTRPSNADVYQLFATAVAHRCELGLLLYPSTASWGAGERGMRRWNVQLDKDKSVTLAAASIDVVGLSFGATPARMHGQILELINALVPKRKGDG